MRQTIVHAPPDHVFAVVENLGGGGGWLYSNYLWQARGLIDVLLGGVGMKRGRNWKTSLRVGDHLDFWRIEKVETNQTLLLRAEMKLPGRAWLQFTLSTAASGGTYLRCCAWFEPRGLAGEIYWWGLYPVHVLIFRGLAKAIKKRTEDSVRKPRLDFPDRNSAEAATSSPRLRVGRR